MSFLLAMLFVALNGREPVTSTIRGTIIDKVTGYALIGANVILLDTDPVTGTSTDLNGNFILEEVPLGRHSIEISYMGYTTRIVPNLFISAGPRRLGRKIHSYLGLDPPYLIWYYVTRP